LKNVGGLGPEGFIHHAGGKRGAESLLLGALHHDEQHEKRADDDVEKEEDVEQDIHREAQYVRSERFVKRCRSLWC
jgi:hypothetical protein